MLPHLVLMTTLKGGITSIFNIKMRKADINRMMLLPLVGSKMSKYLPTTKEVIQPCVI